MDDKYKYKEIENYILDNIYQGNFLSGSLLPTQQELCERFSVSRMTVIKALEKVEETGMIKRVQGSGCYVNLSSLHESSINMLSFTETYEKRGIKVRSVLLYYELKQIPDADMAKKLKVSPTEIVHFIKRLRYGNDKPMAVQILYISASRIPNLDLSCMNKSFYKYVEVNLNKKLGNGTSNLSIVKPTAEIKKLLNITDDSPVVCTKHITCFSNMLPFEYIETYQRYETYSMDFFNTRIM